jgi:RNA polymerase sigma-70 factor (ECF subfamily)
MNNSKEFESIYTTYWPKVFRLSMGYLNNRDVAQDMTQETFIKVWQQFGNFRNEASIGTWIFRIASNHCLRQLEKDKRMPKSDLMPIFNQQDSSKPDLDGQMEFLYRCISELPEIDRIIISLELEDIQQADIADIVGISKGNVRVKIHRIKEKLKAKFKHYER